MRRVASVIVGIVAAVVAPVAVAISSSASLAHRPVASVLFVLIWELVVGLASLTVRALRQPAGRRLDQIGAAVDLALGRRVSRYGRRYRRHVLNAQRFIDAKDLATPGDRNPELDDVFVDVGLVPTSPHEVSSGVLTELSVDVPNRHSIWEFLDRSNPVALAVIGGPGSGKTTLLRHVARLVARTPRRRPRAVPVLLELRDRMVIVATDPRPTLPEVIRTAVPTFGISEPSGWWEDQLSRGKCLVLFDGLDEVASMADRRALATWIETQIDCYPDNHYVITSRPHGYQTALIKQARVLQVRPFTDEQVRYFLHGWYRAVERTTRDYDSRTADRHAEMQAAALLERLAHVPVLYDLTTNPLLLTMIANVHRYRGALPGSRADLYGEVCQVMLWRRQETKGLPNDLAGPRKLRLLAQLAFLMMQQRVRDLCRDEILTVFRESLKRVSTPLDAEGFLDDVGCNGLLVEREKGQYSFAHHTFQEYLAATHIRDKALDRVLVDAVGDDWWRETTLLYVADADAESVVQACLNAGSITALSLAFDCLDNGGEVSPELRASVDAIMDHAFDAGAAPEHRALIASILAIGHLRAYLSTPLGTRLCSRPVPRDLYWLFLQETKNPPPDRPCEPGLDWLDLPVAGVWESDVVGFLGWMNSLISASGHAGCRLPTRAEIDSLAQRTGPATQPSTEVLYNIWLAPDNDTGRRGVWSQPGILTAHEVSGRILYDMLAKDVIEASVLTQIIHACVHVRTAILRDYLDREPRDTVSMNGQDIVRTLTRDRAHALCDAFASTLDLNLAMRTELALDLATQLATAVNRNISYTPDVSRAVYPVRQRLRNMTLALAQALARGLDLIEYGNDDSIAIIAHTLALVDPPIPAPDGNFDGSWPASFSPFLVGEFPEILRKDRAVSGFVIQKDFVKALLSVLKIAEKETFTVSLDALSDSTQRVGAFFEERFSVDTWTGTVAHRLNQLAAPIFTRNVQITNAAAAAVRLGALLLAVDVDENDGPIRATLLDIAAGITLMQQRCTDQAVLETLVLVPV